MRIAALAFAALFAVACSSSSSDATTPGTDTGTSDGGCVNPVEGASCRASDTLCAGNEGGCCAGYVWQCESGGWKKMGLGCACLTDAGDDGDAPADAPSDAPADAPSDTPADVHDAGPFTCGAASCTAGQYCTEQGSGIDGGSSSHSCAAVPSACTATPTCDCLKAHAPSCAAPTCTTDAAGHMTLHCLGA